MPAIPPIPAVIAPQPESFMKLRLSKRAMASSPSNFLLGATVWTTPSLFKGTLGCRGSLLREKGMVGRLENKVAIVTGGAGGIGAATGLLFCQEGGRVVLVDNDSGAMRVAVSHIQDMVPGARAVAVVADVGKEETASEVVAQTRKAFGAIDVLVNIAGIRAYEPLAVARRDTWEKIIAVNLMSYAYFIRQAITDLRASGRADP